MAAGVSDFPTSLDTTSNQPTAATLSGIQLDGDGTANNIHSNVHGVTDTAVVALETKLGTGATAPTATAVLVGTGSGTSAWDTTPTFGAIAATTVDATTDFTVGGTVITDGAITDTGSLVITPTTDTIFANGTGVVIGHTAQISTGDLNEFQILGTGTPDSRMTLGRWSADAGTPEIHFIKSRNATIGSSTILQDNDPIFRLTGFADDGTDFANQAFQMLVEVDDASPAANDVGAAWAIRLAEGGGTAVRDVLRASAAGAIEVPVGSVFIGDTANDNMTQGLTINQGAADNEILALKSSDVVHGMTALTETDTFLKISKITATGGGTELRTFSTIVQSARIIGVGTGDNTGKTTSSQAVISLMAAKANGTSVSSPGTNANLVAIRDFATDATRFLFDIEGSAHADVEWTTYDTHDDLTLIRDMESELLLREDTAQTPRRHMLEQVGIIGQDSWHMENGKQRAMVDFTQLSMLHHGALIQVQDRFVTAEDRIKELETVIAGLLPAGE
jgi:hypothetical protein